MRIPDAQRRAVHAGVGEWIARLASDRREEFVDLLAHHFEQAAGPDDDDGEVRIKAVAALIAERLRAHATLLCARYPGAFTRPDWREWAVRQIDEGLAGDSRSCARSWGSSARARGSTTASRRAGWSTASTTCERACSSWHSKTRRT